MKSKSSQTHDDPNWHTYYAPECAVFRKTKETCGGFSNMSGLFPLQLGKIRVLTGEAAYQLFRFRHRPDIQKEILDQTNPMRVKFRAKHHCLATRPDWEDIRVDVMRWALRVKLAHHPDRFGGLLLASLGRPDDVKPAPLFERAWKAELEPLLASFGGPGGSPFDPSDGRRRLDQLHQRLRKKFFTVGYGGRSPADFVQLLQKEGVRTVVDVRLRPDRASMGAYVRAGSNDKGIVRLLGDCGIAYESFVELGNVFYERPDWQEKYANLIQAAGSLLTERLEAIPGPLAFLCAEKLPAECHRMLIADDLVKRGWKLRKHIV